MSDLRDVKFNTKPHYDFYFSAPDQQIVNHLSQNHRSGIGSGFLPPNSVYGVSGHNRTYSGNNLNMPGGESSWQKSSGHKFRDKFGANATNMSYSSGNQYPTGQQQPNQTIGVVYNSPVPPGQAESSGMEMMMEMQYMPYWNGQTQHTSGIIQNNKGMY